MARMHVHVDTNIKSANTSLLSGHVLMCLSEYKLIFSSCYLFQILLLFSIALVLVFHLCYKV